MKKYLRSFQDQSAYDAAKQREDFYKPCVSLISGSSLQYDPLAAIPEGFVDFGLPSGTLWYNKNLGATNGNTAESWYGGYYAWGELNTKTYYDWTNPNDATQNYKYANGAYNKLTKYCNNSQYGNDGYTDELTQLVPSDDVATVTNSAWRMPTEAEIRELLAGTSSSWVEDYNDIEGLNGRVFIKASITQQAFKNATLYSEMFEGELTEETWNMIKGYSLEEINAMIGGDIREMMFKDEEMTTLAEYGTDYGFVVKQTDSSISMFIPAAGYRNRSDIYAVGSNCGLWSSSLSLDDPCDAYYLYFFSDSIGLNDYNRYRGFTVRPVLAVS